jgi:hypothetical protein
MSRDERPGIFVHTQSICRKAVLDELTEVILLAGMLVEVLHV